MKMGLTLHTGDMSMDGIVDYTQYAESLGYDCQFLTEESGKEAFSVLAILAQETEKIDLATGIINFYSRSPTLIAMGVSTLDQASDERIRLGLGSGGIGFMKRGHGIEIEKPLTRAREYVEIIRALLSGERMSYDGEWFNPENFRLRETPPRADVEICLAALNPKMTQLAGEIADGVILNCINRDSLPEVRENLSIGAERASRDPSEVTIYTLTMTCPDNENKDAVHAMKKGLAFYADSPHYHHLFELSGFLDEAKRLKEIWDNGEHDRAAREMSDEMVETFTLTGSESNCVDRLRFYQQNGVYPIIYPVPRRDEIAEDMNAAIELAAEYEEEI